jgi:hypothetical protein
MVLLKSNENKGNNFELQVVQVGCTNLQQQQHLPSELDPDKVVSDANEAARKLLNSNQEIPLVTKSHQGKLNHIIRRDIVEVFVAASKMLFI